MLAIFIFGPPTERLPVRSFLVRRSFSEGGNEGGPTRPKLF